MTYENLLLDQQKITKTVSKSPGDNSTTITTPLQFESPYQSSQLGTSGFHLKGAENLETWEQDDNHFLPVEDNLEFNNKIQNFEVEEEEAKLEKKPKKKLTF